MLGKERGFLAVHKTQEASFGTMRGVTTEHHGNLAGSNDHQDADIGIIIGGAFASPHDTASIAAARGGGAVTVAVPVRARRAVLLSEGSAVEIDCLAYEDPASDPAHRGVYDASVIQAIGRMRPMQRTVHNPAIGYVFANVALPFPVTSVQRWQDVRPSRVIRMIARERVWLNAVQMATFRTDLFKTTKAAEAARTRFAGSVENVRDAVRAIVRHDTRPWLELVFQPHGQGQRISSVLIPAGAEAATRDEIEAELGALRLCQTVPFTRGREVTPATQNQAFIPAPGVTSLDAAVPMHVAASVGHDATPRRAEHPPDG